MSYIIFFCYFINSFTYRITNNDDLTSDATVTINFTPVSDATPVATADSMSVNEGVTATTMVGRSATGIHEKVPNIDDLLLQADDAMYRAKENGRNRICLSENS